MYLLFCDVSDNIFLLKGVPVSSVRDKADIRDLLRIPVT
uniref:Uncharacterized protein n=1 Tax=Lepeophtheirus salmonis TaxID=72036 RepID=A0A0K2T7P4_LEPSM